MGCGGWNKIDLFIGMEGDPLKKYDYYFKNIDFSKCNYCFIIPDHLSDVFISFYTKTLKNAFIFFPKDFEQAKELLNDYENELGYKENWIIISPCIELEKNIKIFHENKDIICFIGYCPIFNHHHDKLFFYSFSKFYGIVNSSNELIEKLFELSNIFYYRKKQKYELDININVIELKYDNKFLIEIKNECSKNSTIDKKLNSFFRLKMANDQYYFDFIQTFNLLKKYLEEKQYNLLFSLNGKLEDFIVVLEDSIEKGF